MTNPACKRGVCTGTVPVADGTECTYAGLEKCYTPGSCKSIPLAGLSFCTLGTPKTCQQPADPCKRAACNPQTGNCEVGDMCFTFSGCEVCNAGTCTAVNTGGACANPEGDFNPCTTNDHCAIRGAADTLPDVAANSGVPIGLAAAMSDARQVGVGRSLCMGVAGGAPGPTATPTAIPTPTVEPPSCVGDCGGNGEVTVDELLTMVNIALGNAQVSACLRGDADGNGEITIGEIISAVNRALNSCG
jgi:hypothetical protein